MNTSEDATSFDAVLPMPSCRLGIRLSNGKLDALVFLAPDTPLRSPASTLARDTEHQLQAWLADPRSAFGLPLNTHGTPFQQRVWRAISLIPLGETRHYSELCASAGGTARAIGQACGANPFPIVVPCHRVLAKSGIGGFANARDGWLLDTKIWLLRHEGVLA